MCSCVKHSGDSLLSALGQAAGENRICQHLPHGARNIMQSRFELEYPGDHLQILPSTRPRGLQSTGTPMLIASNAADPNPSDLVM